jgi:parallel beta-helix repeat protein
MRRSGTSTAPITFSAYPGEQPVVDGHDAVAYTVRLVGARYVNLVGLTIQGGFAERHAGGGVAIDSSAFVQLRDNLLRNNKAFGVRTSGSTNVLIDSNDITGNAVGVHVTGYSAGTVVSNNLIHDNTRMMVNTADVANDDAGAEGVALVRSTGSVVVKQNTIWGNRSPSYDYGYDGGAFSIYAASGWTITDNVTFDNRNVLETGTDVNQTPCDGNAFTRNLNYGATTADRTVGMVLRCASNTLVANNTFYDIQYFVFAISHNRSGWGGSIEGLRIVNNVISGSAKVYGIDSEVPASVVIDNNVVQRTGSGHIATVYGYGGTTSWATFRSWTGFESRGQATDPRFVDVSANDYRLAADSPAVDRAMHVAGVTDTFHGAGPDVGFYERP